MKVTIDNNYGWGNRIYLIAIGLTTSTVLGYAKGSSTTEIDVTFDDSVTYTLGLLAIYRDVRYKLSNQSDNTSKIISITSANHNTISTSDGNVYFNPDSDIELTNTDTTIYVNTTVQEESEHPFPDVTPTTQNVTITEGTLTNCSVSYTPTTVSQGNDVTFTFTATNGYEFTTAPYVVDNAGTNYTATISSDKLSATITITTTTTITTLTTNGSATEISVTPTINNQTITNLSDRYSYAIIYKTQVSVSGATWYLAKLINAGETVTLTSDDFANTPYNAEYFISSSDTTQIYYKLNDTVSGGTANVTATIDDVTYNRYSTAIDGGSTNTLSIAENETYFDTTVTINENNLENCSVSYTPTSVNKGDTVVITWSANSNYHFITAPYIITTNTSSETNTINSTIADDGLSATLTITDTANVNIIDIYGRAVAITAYTYNFITIYNVSSENLLSLSTKRFIDNYDTIDKTVYIVDLANYITSLKLFYCDVPITESQSIVLGRNHNTGITAPVLSNDKTTIDCGEVTIESTNNNTNDYDNNVTIILPFIGMRTLDADKIMNATIKLRYEVSLINGSCVAFISNGDIDIYAFEGKIAIDIPYILDRTYRTEFSLDENILYGFTPKIIIAYNENYNADNTILVGENKYSILSDLTGLNYIEDVIVTGLNIPVNELNMILDELQNGVIF